VAARALFLMALEEAEQLNSIRSELVERATSREPITRIEANQALFLLDKIAAPAHAADPADEESWEERTRRLESYTEFDFFGPEFTWAAGEARDWMAQRAAEVEAADAP
jgi:hypothetical protein